MLTTRGEEMRDALPYYWHDTDFALRVIDSCARELDRLEAFLTTVRDKAYVHQADDEFNTLGIWEQTMGLPVKPANATLSERQTDALAAFRSRLSSSGQDWVNVATTVIGSGSWTHVENFPTPYDITITLPYTYATTTLTGSHTLPQTTITVGSTTGFPSTGLIVIGGTQQVAYTGTTATTFTGATGGVGTFGGGTTVTTGADRAGRVESLLRAITPAHLNLVVTYGEGFIVGESIVGEEAI